MSLNIPVIDLYKIVKLYTKYKNNTHSYQMYYVLGAGGFR